MILSWKLTLQTFLKDFPNPHTDIIRRYKELGGLYVTVGSDAHKAQFIGSGFDLVEKIVEKYKLKVFTI